MKKYIVPNTEAIDAICGTALCNSNDGTGIGGSDPNPGSSDPNAAPKRASVLYI